ncbi:MAG TPA: hypothetical protein VKX28_07450 [Xanthobacteraceae bacterium]|nr:hypothetical protein [Xanthobacteraceae bacterium]
MTIARANAARALPVFSIAFAAIYIASVNYNLALLTYHPQLGQWAVLVDPPKEGPAMYWYGWLLTSALGAGAVAALSLALPARPVERASAVLVWLVPVAMIALIGYILRGYFLR